MMKEILVELPKNIGSCFNCSKFQDNFLYKIDPVHKLCSKKCLFDFKKSILARYNNNLLKMIWMITIPNIPVPEKRSEAIQTLTEFFTEREERING